MSKKKKNKYAQTPEAEIDLHGLTAVEAEAELERFLAEAEENDWKIVRIITGRGINSPDGRAVLKPLAEEWLSARHYDYRQAKVNQGGEGAFVVKIK